MPRLNQKAEDDDDGNGEPDSKAASAQSTSFFNKLKQKVTSSTSSHQNEKNVKTENQQGYADAYGEGYNETTCVVAKNSREAFMAGMQYQCAIDIIIHLSECLSKNNSELSREAFEVLADSVAEFAKRAEHEHEDGNEQQEQLLYAARCKIVDLAIQWTKQKSSNAQEKKYGAAAFHGRLAAAFDSVKHTELARNHYLLSDDANGFAKFLKAYKQNYELVIVEAVLQILCLDRFPFAVALFNAYVAPAKLPFDIPLLNFQFIMFDVIETENRAQFTELTESYSSEFARNPAFVGYLMRIGKLYFAIRDNQCMNMGLGGILGNLFGGQKEEEVATSHRTARTPVRQQPAPSAPSSAGFPPFFAPPPAAVAPPPKPKQSEVEEDLD